MTRFHVASRVRLIAAVLFATPLAAQSPAMQQGRTVASLYFKSDDALEINTDAIADMSADGRWLALTHAVRRDSYGTDYRHDGDPSYVHVAPVRLWSVAAKTGQRTA